MSESGYDPFRVARFVREHGYVRETDGRPMRLGQQPLPESYRNTLARWFDPATRPYIIPLGRWDEILLGVGLMLWEYEQWEDETYGNLSYREVC